MSLQPFGKIYWKFEKAIAPELTSSQYHYQEKLFANLREQEFAWLDRGCGQQVFVTWMKREQNEMVARTERRRANPAAAR